MAPMTVAMEAITNMMVEAVGGSPCVPGAKLSSLRRRTGERQDSPESGNPGALLVPRRLMLNVAPWPPTEAERPYFEALT
jgi:hypothetical protein